MRILKADHRAVEQLLTKLAETDEGPERQELLDEVRMKLLAHMELEESLLYPVLAQRVGEEDEEEATVEHNLAREGVDKMVAMVDQPGFGAAVEMVKAGVLHHVKEEESELLPQLKDDMTREEWVALGDAIVEAKEAAGLPVPEPTRRKSAKRTTKSGTGSTKGRNGKK
jgi:iron-sulfur cluster repair protein YtfE (RIC family)